MPLFADEPSNWVHHTAWVEDNVKIHYVRCFPSNPNGRTLVLLHGYPSTWYSFRHVIQPFADLGYDVIAADYRGAGDSNKPMMGYDKMSMARDIHSLYHHHLGIDRAILCGYDIGSMVATSLALQYRNSVEALIVLEAPLPGTNRFDILTTDPQFTWSRVFHYYLHMQSDLPEMLTEGRERMYIKHFYDRLCYDPSFYTVKDLDIYTTKFQAAGAMRAGFEVYRAFLKDADDVRANLKEHGKINIATLATGGEHSRFTSFIADQAREFSTDVTHSKVPHSNHWCPEENPRGFVEDVHGFLAKRGFGGVSN